MKKTVLVKCMHGIGDTIYARPFIKMLCQDPENDVYLRTALPFLFSDLPVKFIEITPDKTLRTQSKYLKTANINYVEPLEKWDREIDYFYGNDHILGRNGKRMNSIITHIEQSFGFEPGSTKPVFDFPPLPHHGLNLPTDKKIAVVRPVTIRREWSCTSRAPKDNYIPWCAKTLMDQGWHVISIADCEDDQEWMERMAEPLAHEHYHQGELGMPRTFSLLQAADLIIGGPSFILPAGVASGTDLFIIFGGRGKFDNPHKLFDLRMDLTKLHWVLPDNFCRCQDPNHNCDKTIKNLDDEFFKIIKDIQLKDKKMVESISWNPATPWTATMYPYSFGVTAVAPSTANKLQCQACGRPAPAWVAAGNNVIYQAPMRCECGCTTFTGTVYSY